ncbi:MAG: hypothetical protein ACRDGA_07550 [Bacteroidota bacterium]
MSKFLSSPITSNVLLLVITIGVIYIAFQSTPIKDDWPGPEEVVSTYSSDYDWAVHELSHLREKKTLAAKVDGMFCFLYCKYLREAWKEHQRMQKDTSNMMMP